MLSLIIDIHQIDVLPWLGCREPFNCFSHLIGAAVFAGLAPNLIHRGRGSWVRVISLSIMAGASVLLLLISASYHLFWPGPIREIMLRCDVAAVFVLIAASMTPGHAILFSGLSRWGSLALIWTVAIGGIIWRILFCENTPGAAGIAFFLLFGWASVISAAVLWIRYGWSFIRPAVCAGLSYTVGAIVLVLHRPILVPGYIGAHEIWHIAVLAGIGFQWRFITQFASGKISSFRDELSESQLIIGPLPE